MTFPILKNLEIGAAVRYDDYSDFGGTTNPKVSFRYTPVDMLLLRGSYNTGFAAPTMTQSVRAERDDLHRDPLQRPGAVSERRTECGTAGGIASRDCGIQFQQLHRRQRRPAAGEVGCLDGRIRLAADAEFSFGLDYWNYHIEDSISVIGDQSIFADPTKYANLFVRCSEAPPARQFASAPARRRAAIRWPTSSTPT